MVSGYAFYIFLMMVFWAAFLTYHELREKSERTLEASSRVTNAKRVLSKAIQGTRRGDRDLKEVIELAHAMFGKHTHRKLIKMPSKDEQLKLLDERVDQIHSDSDIEHNFKPLDWDDF